MTRKRWGRNHCQCSCSSTCLGAHLCLHLFRHPGEQVLPVPFLHPGTGFVLPTRSHSAWLEVVGFPRWWSCPPSCCFPTGRFKSHDSNELTTSHLCGLKETFEARAPTQRPVAWQPGGDAQQCVCPTRQERWGCSHDKRITTRCLPEQKAWKQLRPRRPLALEMCGEFCTDTPTPWRHVSDKTWLPSGAQPLWPHGGSTVNQKQPRRLHILDHGNAGQQCVTMCAEHLLVAKRCA